MRILAVDSSAKTAGVAICDDDKIVGEFFIDNGLTHSHTLMPMIQSCIDLSGVSLSSLDAYAVSIGPGSFTGLRIGIACVKGIATVSEKPCYGVSTLEAIAYGTTLQDATLCCLMDARCQQVYAAAFSIQNGVIIRTLEDSALTITDFIQRVAASVTSSPIVLAGDAATMYLERFLEAGLEAAVIPQLQRFPRAYGVARAVFSNEATIKAVAANDLLPKYLRVPQAERELKGKRGD